MHNFGDKILTLCHYLDKKLTENSLKHYFSKSPVCVTKMMKTVAKSKPLGGVILIYTLVKAIRIKPCHYEIKNYSEIQRTLIICMILVLKLC